MKRNRFGIPENELAKIRSRDKLCVYCGEPMLFPYVATNSKKSATIEHLNFDGPFYWKDDLRPEDIVICCGSCNSSRGEKPLPEWFGTPYCIERRITTSTVAPPVKKYLRRSRRA
jgi:5-methylcytosine-specific restriction endonuclease McrA